MSQKKKKKRLELLLGPRPVSKIPMPARHKRGGLRPVTKSQFRRLDGHPGG